MTQYYLNKVFTEIVCDKEHLKKNPDLVKERVGVVLS